MAAHRCCQNGAGNSWKCPAIPLHITRITFGMLKAMKMTECQRLLLTSTGLLFLEVFTNHMLSWLRLTLDSNQKKEKWHHSLGSGQSTSGAKYFLVEITEFISLATRLYGGMFLASCACLVCCSVSTPSEHKEDLLTLLKSKLEEKEWSQHVDGYSLVGHYTTFHFIPWAVFCTSITTFLHTSIVPWWQVSTYSRFKTVQLERASISFVLHKPRKKAQKKNRWCYMLETVF